MKIGELIKAIRRRRNMTQEEFSIRTKLPLASFSSIELGTRSAKLSDLKKIAHEFGCPTFLLVLLSDDYGGDNQSRDGLPENFQYWIGKSTADLINKKDPLTTLLSIVKTEEQQ